MRVKQLLGILLLASGTTAFASTSELSGVQVEKRDQAGVVIILANGAFTHTEYRPTDTLMMVDLAGVSVAHPDTAAHLVSVPAVQSYRVVGYRSAGGAEVARVELALFPGVTAKVNEVKGGLEVRLSSLTTANSNSAPAPAHLSRIRDISVAQSESGLNVEVTGSGLMTAKVIKLTGPDRIVLDIPNSSLQRQIHQIPVNSGDVKDVRAARYQSTPPTTRVVVDMAAMHEYELASVGNKIILKLKTSAALTSPVVAQKTKEEQTVTPESTASENKPLALDLAVIQPVSLKISGNEPNGVIAPAPLQPTSAGEKGKEATIGQNRSDQAAAAFNKPAPPMVITNKTVMSGHASLAAEPAAINAALQQQQQQQPASTTTTATSCTSGRYSGAPLNLDLKDLDIKDFFRLIHELSGLNVVLDPGVKGIVTIDVTDIPWDQALAIVLRNNGLECELEGNVLRIASLETLKAEADARRLQQEAQALAVPRQNYTRYLSYAHSKDVVPIIKKFLSARGDVVSDDRSNAVIIEDIPATLPKVDALLTALDRKSPQVEIEARVVSAQRTFARDIGTQIGFGWGNGTNTATGGGTGIASPITATPPAGFVPPWITIPNQLGQIPLFSNLPAVSPTSGISISNVTQNYRLDFVLTMAESRGLVKILSRPRIVTQNNIPGKVEQGQRIPVVTQSQLGGPPTVTYIDAFLRLTVTPQITSDNTIFLLVDVENTTPDFSRVSGAQLNPTLNTQQATTQVLVSDGQTVVIGGVIQTQNSLAINQVPLLGSIPLLGNLFKHTVINTSTAELLFFLTPKIIQT